MAYQKELSEEIIEVASLRNLVEVYGEIASVRMMKIRGFVLNNRDFLDSINNIFKDVLSAYAQKLSDLVRAGKMKKGRVTFLAHNGKTVAVLISANTGFYGEVVQATFRKFLKEIRESDVEVSIIGRLGRSMFLGAEPKRPYTYFDLPDYGVDQMKLSEIIRHLVQYEKIRVYYGHYKSIVRQEPTMYGIEAGTQVQEEVEAPNYHFIFEPNVEKILMFFETEIFASLFDQSVRESQLAKYASRILAMDRAGQNIKERIKQLNLEKLKLSHAMSGRKQLNSLASMIYGDVN